MMGHGSGEQRGIVDYRSAEERRRGTAGCVEGQGCTPHAENTTHAPGCIARLQYRSCRRILPPHWPATTSTSIFKRT